MCNWYELFILRWRYRLSYVHLTLISIIFLQPGDSVFKRPHTEGSFLVSSARDAVGS